MSDRDRPFWKTARIIVAALSVVTGIEALQAGKAISIFEFAAIEHGFAVIWIADRLFSLQPTGFGHGAIGLVVRAFPGLVVGEVFYERGAQRLECLACGFDVFGFGEGIGLGGNVRGEHFHVVALDRFGDGGSVRIHTFYGIFGKLLLNGE